jgi:RNA polymerase sigma-70 factor (ECF subfamily)
LVPPEAQVAIILKYLCGFGIEEIAQAFLTRPAAVEKRLTRAKQALKREAVVDLPGPRGMARRLGSVHQALYLLFSEGYHGSHPERTVREELCSEAMRLANLLSDHPATAVPSTFALLGLFCLHAARLPSRIDDAGSLILLEAQDRSRWSIPLIEQGICNLGRSAEGTDLTPFHLEAAIAAHHVRARSFEETDWGSILDLYSRLYELRPTAVVALNRAIALGRARGPEEGLRELDRIRGGRRLERYPFLEAAAGDLLEKAGRRKEARDHFRRAVALARNDLERKVFESRLAAL